jgi:hypothetical protein
MRRDSSLRVANNMQGVPDTWDGERDADYHILGSGPSPARSSVADRK